VGYEISMMGGFGGLQELKDGMFSVSVIFFRYEISKTVGFVLFRIFNDGRFCSVASQFWWVTRSQ